jgi:hypothetical protein
MVGEVGGSSLCGLLQGRKFGREVVEETICTESSSV